MSKKSILIFLAVILISVLSGCTSRPIYERVDTKESGITVNMDGVIYKMYPRLKWEVHPDDNLIGYAGNRKTGICFAKGDTEKNFIYLQDAGASMYYTPLHRTDKLIPEPSADTVDTINWHETKFKNKIYDSSYGNSIMDKDYIRAFYNIFEIGKRTKDYKIFNDYSINITGYSDKVPGAYYELDLKNSNGKLVCGNFEEGYVEIPIELLERIAGHKINLAELLS